jgi:hypothetical protein
MVNTLKQLLTLFQSCPRHVVRRLARDLMRIPMRSLVTVGSSLEIVIRSTLSVTNYLAVRCFLSMASINKTQ